MPFYPLYRRRIYLGAGVDVKEKRKFISLAENRIPNPGPFSP
jgi:hypothetical protein